jgi:molecular chaperone DnaK
VKEETPLEKLRSLTSELQQVFHGLGAVSAGATAGQGQAGVPDEGSSDDDVIDAEFTTS